MYCAQLIAFNYYNCAMKSIIMLLSALLKCQGGKCISVPNDAVSGRYRIHPGPALPDYEAHSPDHQPRRI